jgi:TolA-binding protein
LLGDLAAADGRIDDALAAYRAAEEAGAQLDPPHFSYINHAIFQGGRLLAANQRWAEMARWFETYIARWGREGKLSDALFELGRARDAQGQRDEALAGWLEAIVRFGNDPTDHGPDLMLLEYAEKYDAATGRRPVVVLREALATALLRSEPTLALRLAYALRSLGEENESWPRVSSPEAFPLASAAVLLRVAERSEKDEPGLALAAAETAVARQPPAPLKEEALHRCGALRADGDRVAEALAAYRQAAAEFPTSRRTAVARLREGDLLRRLGDFDAAIAAYRAVLQTRQWRGVAWAEANFKIGLAHLEAGEFKEAFGFSQRVYVLYGSIAEWAAPAYLQSGIALERLGRPEDARTTYRELLAHEKLRDTSAAREAESRLASLP